MKTSAVSTSSFLAKPLVIFTAMALGGCSLTDIIDTGMPDTSEKPLTVEQQIRQLRKQLQNHEEEWKKGQAEIERLLTLETQVKQLTARLDQLNQMQVAQRAVPQQSQPSTTAAPRPQAQAQPQAITQPQAQPAAQAKSPRTGTYALHIASFKNQADIEPGWQRLTAQYPQLLGDLEPRIKGVELGAEHGIFYRLKVGPFAQPQDANALCGQLKSAGNDCVLSTFDGVSVSSQTIPTQSQTQATTTPGSTTTSGATVTQGTTGIPASQSPASPTYALQLASYKNKANLQRGWQVLRQKFPEILRNKNARTTSITLDGGRGTFYRLLAGPVSDRAAAQQLCALMINQQASCVVTRFKGEPVGQ